ncbi:hypothetical protein [Streptococcus parasanguinis]|uniref:hypothetical protein n=1 Tax=Streptococcus parasanguinis TaxID=1318 RepID=UPI00077983CD|nr:hypothetical protein [Streptococcus parasanguinis]
MKDSVLEFRKIMDYAPILYVLVFLLVFTVLLFLRRRAIARRSSGPFFAPFHINRGIFYIHVPLCFRRRMIPLKDIKQITYAIFRGRSGGGSRYAFYIELRNGKTIPFFFGKSKRNEELVNKLKRNAGRYGFKVHDPG